MSIMLLMVGMVWLSLVSVDANNCFSLKPPADEYRVDCTDGDGKPGTECLIQCPEKDKMAHIYKVRCQASGKWTSGCEDKKTEGFCVRCEKKKRCVFEGCRRPIGQYCIDKEKDCLCKKGLRGSPAYVPGKDGKWRLSGLFTKTPRHLSTASSSCAVTTVPKTRFFSMLKQMSCKEEFGREKSPHPFSKACMTCDPKSKVGRCLCFENRVCSPLPKIKEATQCLVNEKTKSTSLLKSFATTSNKCFTIWQPCEEKAKTNEYCCVAICPE